MISKIIINNFQSHSHSEIEFNNGVNVISGTSDSGKSAIIRAISWVLFNKPSGDAFRSWFAKKSEPTFVTIEFDTGDSVTRMKSSKGNEYIINDGKPLKAIGTGVPKEVTDITNMQDINLQPQYKSYFLLDESPGKVAKAFNEVANLTIMDDALQEINQRVRAQNDKLKAVEKVVAEEKENVANLSMVPAMVDVFNELIDDEATVINIRNMCEDITNVSDSISSITDELSKSIPKEVEDKVEVFIVEAVELDNMKSELTTIDKVISHVVELTDSIQAIGDLDVDQVITAIEDARLLSSDINKAGGLSSSIEKAVSFKESVDSYRDMAKATADLNAVIGLYNGLTDSVETNTEISELLIDIESIDKQIATTDFDITFSEANFEAYKNEIGICPTCERAF